MSEQEGRTHLALNQRDQPVELHFEGRVVVLPPYGQAELYGPELGSPQLQALVRERLVTVEAGKASGAEEGAQPLGAARGGEQAGAESETGKEPGGEPRDVAAPFKQTENPAEKGDK